MTHTAVVSRVILLAGLAACGIAGTALARIVLVPAAAAGGGGVPLPHVMRDNMGVQWDIGADGSVQDGGNDLYDGGGRLTLNNNAVYQSPNQQAQYDAATNELIFPPMQMNGLSVHRRVAVNAARNWCRWTEVLENPSGQPIHVNLHVHWDLGGSVQQFQPVEDEKRRTPLGVAIFDGQRGLAMISGGRGAKVVSRYQVNQNSDQVEQHYEVDVPAKQTAVIVHFQAMRGSMNEAQAFIAEAKDKELLEGIDKVLRRSIVNFKRSESIIGDIELPRSDLLDIVEMRSGDQYRGTLKDAAFKLETFHGPVELPAERVVGMLSAGTYRHSQLFITLDGEIIGGTLAGAAPIRMQLTTGQTVSLPLSAIAKLGCRKRPGEPEEWKLDKPMAFLRDGQRIAVDAPTGSIAVATLYGNVSLRPEWIASLILHGEDQALHQVRLRDGSRFNGVIGGDTVELRLRGAGSSAADSAAGSGAAVKFPLSSLSRLQLVVQADDAAAGADEVPSLSLGNGDVLVGTADGTLELETAFDVLKLNGPEVRGIRHVEAPVGGRASPAEVTVTMWDGATVSGRIRGDAVSFALKSGQPVRVPVSLIGSYQHPNPAPPPQMLERLRETIRELSDADWKKRERAAAQLRGLGQPAIGVLKEMRDGQPPEAQKQIDALLKMLEKERAAAEAATRKQSNHAAPAAGPQGNREVQERQFPLLKARVWDDGQ